MLFYHIINPLRSDWIFAIISQCSCCQLYWPPPLVWGGRIFSTAVFSCDRTASSADQHENQQMLGCPAGLVNNMFFSMIWVLQASEKLFHCLINRLATLYHKNVGGNNWKTRVVLAHWAVTIYAVLVQIIVILIVFCKFFPEICDNFRIDF
jgi:hypothetical protein